ncbi:MAG TPA: hypothetical protein VF615_09180 [Longimicrobiaceae bacterium]|jgi:hypothetical protein
MIDPATGEVRLPSADVVLGPRLTRGSFLGSRLAEHARDLEIDEPRYACLFFIPPGGPGETAFRVSLRFHGESLTSLELVAVDARFGTSWSDWTEEKELDRCRFHDEWLETASGLKPGRYSWGVLESRFDPKGGFSSIIVDFQ